MPDLSGDPLTFINVENIVVFQVSEVFNSDNLPCIFLEKALKGNESNTPLCKWRVT